MFAPYACATTSFTLFAISFGWDEMPLPHPYS
jgi:hypothetical protein